MAGIKHVGRIKATNKEQHPEITKAETELSKYNCKTNNYIKFKDYINEKYKCNKIIKKYYEEEMNRKLNWRTKTYRQSSEDKFLNNIEKTFKNANIYIIMPFKSIQLNNLVDLDIKSMISTVREALIQMTDSFDSTDTDLLNIRDEILGDINKFLYLMTFNK